MAEILTDNEQGKSANHDKLDARPLFLAPTTEGKLNTISLDLQPVACVSLHDVLFEFDSSFVMPESKAMLADIPGLREKHKSKKGEYPPLSVFGHADPVGDDTYNKILSGRRSKAIYGLLIKDPAVWDSLYSSPHGGDNWQQKNAVKTMAAATGKPESTTRKDLMKAYMDFLCPFTLTKADFLGKGADAGGRADYQGCSEFNPLMILSTTEASTLPKADRDAENKRNRRVVVYLFCPNVKLDPASWPCPAALDGSAKCKERFWKTPKTGEQRRAAGAERREWAKTKDTFACRFYERIARLSPCEGPVPPPPVTKVYDLTNVKTASHIAPNKEKIKIEYDIVNKANTSIDSGRLEILRKKDNKVLHKVDLKPEQFKEGHHDTFEWDGAVTKDKEFPDGFVTIEHSDYIVKVTVKGDKGDKTGQAEVKVELKDFKIELAPKAVLKKDPDKAVYDLVGALPAAAKVTLKLRSNVYTLDAGDEMTDASAFTKYKDAWGDGPRIPILATATVIDSKGAEVRCGAAMGRARVLWDYEDPPQTQPAYQATKLDPPPATNKSAGAKPFVDKALKYDKTATRPKNGDNCHKDRGGKRDSAAGQKVFEAADADVEKFPFSVEAGKTRWWGYFSKFEKAGDEEGRSGAIFRPARMAGDSYKVTAYLDLPEGLDVAADKPTGALKEVKVGEFEVWRLIYLAEHFKKGPQTTGAMPGIAQYYSDAFIEVEDKTGGVKDLTKAQYDALFTSGFAVAGGNALVRKYGLAPGGQWDAAVPPAAAAATAWIGTFLPYAQFRAAVSAGEGVTGAALQALLNTNNVGDANAHADRVNTLAKSVGDEMVRIQSTKEGITVLQFNGVSNLEPLLSGVLNGRAVSHKAEANRDKSGFLLTRTGAGTEQTPAHEIGHLTFLPHAPRLKADGTVINSGGGITPDFHDKANMNCVMSYARPRPGFCGLCILRLRGWKGSEFDRNGPKTTK